MRVGVGVSGIDEDACGGKVEATMALRVVGVTLFWRDTPTEVFGSAAGISVGEAAMTVASMGGFSPNIRSLLLIPSRINARLAAITSKNKVPANANIGTKR